MPDREEVIKEWEAVLNRDPLNVTWDLIDDTLTLLKEQPEIILCKYCKYCDISKNGCNSYCRKGNGITQAYGFCSDAASKYKGE